MFTSTVQARSLVTNWPSHINERIYMVPFMQSEGLPDEINRWQGVVDTMLEGIETDKPIYIMVDQGVVEHGKTHRRPGVHIDGYWCPDIFAHGGGHAPSRGLHYPSRGGHRSRGSHISAVRGAGGWDTSPPNWHTSSFQEDEAIILASDISAARAYSGQFSGHIGDGGDCSTINLDDLELIDMQANQVYAGNVTMLHESVPVQITTPRSLVRLNLPGVRI